MIRGPATPDLILTRMMKYKLQKLGKQQQCLCSGLLKGQDEAKKCVCSFRKARLVCAEKEDHSLIVLPSGRNVEDTQKIS